MVFNATFNNISLISWIGGNNAMDRGFNMPLLYKCILVYNKQVHNIISDANY